MVGPSDFTGVVSLFTDRNDIPLPDSDIEKVKSCFRGPISNSQARAYVSSIREVQVKSVLHELARKHPEIARDWARQNLFIWEKLPEDLKPHILGPDFSEEQFVRWLLITRAFTDPEIVYRLTDRWECWAHDKGLHPNSPGSLEKVVAELCDIGNMGATEDCGEPTKAKETPLLKVSKRGRKPYGPEVRTRDKQIYDARKRGEGYGAIAERFDFDNKNVAKRAYDRERKRRDRKK